MIEPLPVIFHDLGTPHAEEHRARRAHFRRRVGGTRRTPQQPYLQWSTRPTLAVLPFRTIGGTESDRYFGEGITEDIITGLSRSRSFYVIARTSMLRYRDRSKDMRQSPTELDVRYVLDGSVRRQRHPAAYQFRTDRRRSQPADLGAAVRRGRRRPLRIPGPHRREHRRIVRAEAPRRRNGACARTRPTASTHTTACSRRSRSSISSPTRAIGGRGAARARDRLDPSYAQAHAYVAWRLNFYVGEGRSAAPDADRALALEASQRASSSIRTTLSRWQSRATSWPSSGEGRTRPSTCSNNALRLNENSAFAWGLSALTCNYHGQPDEAIERLRNVWRLSPFDPLELLLLDCGRNRRIFRRRYGEAVAWLAKSRRANPRFIACLRILAASYALAGDEAAAEFGRPRVACHRPWVSNFVVSRMVPAAASRRPEAAGGGFTGSRPTGIERAVRRLHP